VTLQRVHGHDGAVARGKQDRQAAGSAADIHREVRRQFADEGQVGIQVVTVPVEGVVGSTPGT
jgi:hypothetical protein